MSFYDEWVNNMNLDTGKRYLELFLKATPESIEVFHDGTKSELEMAISVINSIAIERYVEVIDGITYTNPIMADQVPQFSDFYKGIYRVPELLEFSPQGMSFEELGYQLVKSSTEWAAIKYGENHSKLASTMELVEIRKRPSNVTSTALGKYLISFLPDEKNELLKRLAIRQYMAQKMIHDSADGIISYRKVVYNLSMATAIRRRNNVRIILDFILKGTKYGNRLNNINWQVIE